MSTQDILVPNIGDFDGVDVIEVLVNPGDTIEVEQSLITVESDKASMEVPSSHAGVVKEVLVNLGDKVNKGNEIVVLETAGAAAAPAPNGETPSADAAPAPVAAMNEPDVAPEAGSGPAAQTATAAASGPASVSAGGPSQLASMPPERHSPTEA